MPSVERMNDWLGHRRSIDRSKPTDGGVSAGGDSSQAISMHNACYDRRMANVQVKRVPEELHEALRKRARGRGISLNDLLLEVLRREVGRPSVAEWARDTAGILGPVEYDTEKLMDEIRGPWPS